MIDFSPKTILEWTRLGMRKAFGKQMLEIAKDNDDLLVLTADVMNPANLGEFKEKYPKKFFNFGIAEQNMTAIGCGLAKEYNNVFIVSFAPFVTMRNYEALRTLVGYMRLNVKIIGLAGGFSLGVQGNTHYCLEDIALMNSIPGMMILSPADVIEEARCLSFLASYDGPAYLRLTGIDGSACVYKGTDDIDISVPHMLREGKDIAILCAGSIASECVRAARALKKDGISCAVYDICCIKPLNKEFINEISERYDTLAVVEEHRKFGGLGTIICDLLSQSNKKNKVLKLAVDDVFPLQGDYRYLLENAKLNAEHIRQQIMDI